MRRTVAIIVAHDIVTDRKSDCSAKLSEPVLKNKTRIKAEYIKLRIKRPKTVAVRPLRYARVNTLMLSTEECLRELDSIGFKYADTLPDNNEDATNVFCNDLHIRDLLVFAAGTDLTRTSLYRSGKLILQDKASCMPVAILQPRPSSQVVDACAAPGNKTTQLAASVGIDGKVFAFERDPKRAQILEATLRKHGCDKFVTSSCQDFLRTNPTEYAEVEYALVDPSCSGSGILESFEMTGILDSASSEKTERLKTLSNFQCMILRHAMQCTMMSYTLSTDIHLLILVPSIKRVVYSTCSIHREENEEVVKQVLEAEPNFRLYTNPLPLWHRRGLLEYEFGSPISLAPFL